MVAIKNFIRENVKALKPYSSARDEFSGEATTYLDANENSLGSVLPGQHNRYPDPLAMKLKRVLAEIKRLRPEQIFLGNGSDEAIDLLIRATCEPNVHSIAVLSPSYGMYEVSANVNAVKVIEVDLDSKFQLDGDTFIKAIQPETRLVFLCSPNNPTGNLLKRSEVETVLKHAQAIVVVDEAYIDFSPNESLVPLLETHENLVILQTFSKAWGLAGIRLGMALGSPELISVLNRIKPPYNVSELTQSAALKALKRGDRKEAFVRMLIEERQWLENQLTKLASVQKVYPSDANFLLVQTNDGTGLYKKLLSRGIVVRNRSSAKGCKDCLRITVGNPLDNRRLIAAWKEIEGETSEKISPEMQTTALREAYIKRATNETSIQVQLCLDGVGDSSIWTGLGFFDHMLEQIAKHSLCDLWIAAEGDLHVDEHHTVEDTGLALGDAFRVALGDKQGLERYGFLLPMDESLAQVALDFSGRAFFVWDGEFQAEKVGELSTQLVKHFFQSFANACQCSLHIKVSGENDHHKIESVFKAFGRALKMALKRREGDTSIPSTKGVLA